MNDLSQLNWPDEPPRPVFIRVYIRVSLAVIAVRHRHRGLSGFHVRTLLITSS